jgi:hypothetical protein
VLSGSAAYARLMAPKAPPPAKADKRPRRSQKARLLATPKARGPARRESAGPRFSRRIELWTPKPAASATGYMQS